MSEHISHVAIADDLSRLVQADGRMPEAFRSAVREHPMALHLGGTTRKADLFSPEIVRHCASAEDDPDAGRKLAFVIGSFSHRSIDRHMKPVFHHFKTAPDARIEGGKPVNECTVYCDLVVLREVFGFPDSPEHFEPGVLRGTASVDSALKAAMQRTLIHMHTFNPDVQNIHTWMSSLFKGMQDWTQRIDLYIEAFNRPDEGKWRKYVDETHFYDRNDPVITLARRLHRNAKATVTEAEIDAALAATTTESSRYAQALAHSYGYTRGAARLFRGEIDTEQVKPLLDIGVPELSLGYRPRR